MTSSTSNSEKTFLKFLTLGFLGLCALYAGSIYLFFPHGGTGQNQYQTNRIKSERYLFLSKAPEVVIVGSSLAARLKELPSNWYNLAMPGETSALGLKVIRLRDDLPKSILVEVNPSTREISKKLLDALSSPTQMRLKKQIPLLRDEYQPSLILLSVLRKALGAGQSDPKLSKEFRDALAQKHLAANSEIETKDFQNIFLNDLQHAVEELAKRHVKIIFFEVPTERVLMELERMKDLRALEHEALSSPSYAWVETPSNHGYETSDGLHLVPIAAREFTNYLVEKTKALSSH